MKNRCNNFTENMNLLISRAFKSCKVTSIEWIMRKDNKCIYDQIKFHWLFGKRGYNIKLAGELTG